MNITGKLKSGIQMIAQQFSIVFIAYGLSSFTGSFYSATGESMEPTIIPNSVVFVNTLYGNFKNYEKGDIVIIQSLHDPKNTLCKRIIYKEGDKFTLKNGREIILNKRQVWVEGDNKDNSFDSRSFGPISDYLILGKVSFSLFPLKKFQLQSYF